MRFLLFPLLVAAIHAAVPDPLLNDRCQDYGGRCLAKDEPCDKEFTYLYNTECNGWRYGEWKCCQHQPGDDKDCGITDVPANIETAGHHAANGTWPWLASLRIRGEHYCSASIIDKQWLLTAAHCVIKRNRPGEKHVGLNPEQVKVVVGSGDEQKTYDIASFHPHVRYSYTRYGIVHDIALIRVNAPITFNNNVRKICLPKKRVDYDFNDKRCWTVGRKPTKSDVQQSQVTVLSVLGCWAEWGPEIISKTHVCVNEESNCFDDASSPLMCEDDGHYYLLGTTIFGADDCRKPSVHTRISIYLGWIDEIMSDGHSDLPRRGLYNVQ